MKIDDEFLDLYYEIIRESSAWKTYRECSVEYAMLRLLTQFKDDLPELDDYFMKAFRQVDIVDNMPDIDMAFWHLLDAVDIFWSLFEFWTREEKDEPNDYIAFMSWVRRNKKLENLMS